MSRGYKAAASMARLREARKLAQYGDYHNRQCAECGVQLGQYIMPNRIYCSPRCRQRHHRRVTLSVTAKGNVQCDMERG